MRMEQRNIWFSRELGYHVLFGLSPRKNGSDILEVYGCDCLHLHCTCTSALSHTHNGPLRRAPPILTYLTHNTLSMTSINNAIGADTSRLTRWLTASCLLPTSIVHEDRGSTTQRYSPMSACHQKMSSSPFKSKGCSKHNSRLHSRTFRTDLRRQPHVKRCTRHKHMPSK